MFITERPEALAVCDATELAQVKPYQTMCAGNVAMKGGSTSSLCFTIDADWAQTLYVEKVAS